MAKHDVMLLVTPDGAFVPADAPSAEILRRRKIRRGEVVAANLRRPRKYWQWKQAHVLAQLLIENIDEFRGAEAHAVIKRLQMEANIKCEEIGYKLPGHGWVVQRVPQSLAFASMEQGEYEEFYAELCQHVIDQYWPGLSQEQIDEMASLVGAAA